MTARSKIIGAATRLLSQPSTSAFTYEALAREAGVSRQTLYTQFPTRIELLVGVADHARAEHDVDELAEAIHDAATGHDALVAFVDLHVAFTPKVLTAMRAVELERDADPESEKAFSQRRAGRTQLIRLVIRRLHAEHQLDGCWSVDSACDFVASVTSATFTFDLLVRRGWTVPQLRTRLLHVLETALLPPTTTPPRRATHAD